MTGWIPARVGTACLPAVRRMTSGARTPCSWCRASGGLSACRITRGSAPAVLSWLLRRCWRRRRCIPCGLRATARAATSLTAACTPHTGCPARKRPYGRWCPSTDCAPQIASAQRDVAWADHVVIIFPLWLGTMPAKLKGLLEQVLRKDFAFGPKGFGEARLKGKSARVVVTMGMPAIIYRLAFAAHGVLGLEQGILKLVGFAPVHHNLLGDVETHDASRREHWLRMLEQLGAKGQ